VLLNYAWNDDAAKWLTEPDPAIRRKMALDCLTQLYPDVPDLQDQFTEEFFDISWGKHWAAGDAKFFPGQFRDLYNIARNPEGNIFFAGEHLDINHTWIVGAISSALHACRQLLGTPNLPPIRLDQALTKHTYDYSRVINFPALPIAEALAST
jgi:monoamine oxidase